MTESAFAPGMLLLFLLEILLVDVGGGNWHWPLAPIDASVPEEQPYVLLLHGADVNQSQFVAARHLLHLCGLQRVLSVNYLEGLFHDQAAGLSLPKLADRAAKEIRLLRMQATGGKPKVVLVGHSYGGLVAAHLVEHNKLLEEVSVVAVIGMSSPFGGSRLLAWAKRAIPWVPWVMTARDEEMDKWLVPSSSGLHLLRADMSNNPKRYRFITGDMDPLVLPASALCIDFPDARLFLDGLPHRPWLTDRSFEVPRALVPHVGHYNIAASRMAWEQVTIWALEAAALAG